MNEELIKYFEDKMWIIPKNKIAKYLGKMPVLAWYDNNLVKVDKEGNAKKISIYDWEKLVKEKKYLKTLSSFVYYLSKEFFDKKVILITEEARRGVLSMLETIDDEL